MANRRFRGIAEVAGPAASPARLRMTKQTPTNSCDATGYAKDLLGLDVYVKLAAVGGSITYGGAVGSFWTDILGNCRLVGPAQKGHAEEGGGNTHYNRSAGPHLLTPNIDPEEGSLRAGRFA
jgi:hypothetical protein